MKKKLKKKTKEIINYRTIVISCISYIIIYILFYIIFYFLYNNSLIK